MSLLVGTLFCSVAVGSLNIVNLVLKCEAPHVASLVFTIDLSDDSSFLLCKYFVGSRFARMRPGWSVLRDNYSPSTIVMTPFYKRYRTLNSGDYGTISLTSKCVYRTLLKEKSSPAVLSFSWSVTVGCDFDLMAYWSRVRDTLTEHYKNDVLIELLKSMILYIIEAILILTIVHLANKKKPLIRFLRLWLVFHFA